MRRVIIDTDTAGDDTTAILTALKYFKVEGITIAGGNVQFDDQVRNALYTIELFNPDYKVPVYRGYEEPIDALLSEKHETVENIHGNAGMGNLVITEPIQKPETQHAVDYLVDVINANPGELEIIAIAPLTNIAMVLKKDPSIATKVKHLWIMGGINNSLGNINVSAEYNFYVDPLAAKMVFDSGLPITMIGWDMTLAYGVMDDAEIKEIEALNTKGSKFYMDVNGFVREANKSEHLFDGITHPDSLAVAIAANEAIMTQANEYFVDVETKGEITRGHNIVDLTHQLGKQPNARVCEVVDHEAFKQVMLEVFGGIQ